MNVAFDPWIPVVTITGKPDKASLVSVLSEGCKYADLAVRPHERVALMRLFICVAHAALNGPRNYDEWLDVPAKLPTAVKKYLEEWKDSFEFFHPTKPWLQVAGISKTVDGKTSRDDLPDWTPVSKLNFSFATGNNTTLFDHSGMDEKRSIPIDTTLLSMISFQCFSPGGLVSQVYWNGKQTNKSSKDGPCSPSSMLHAFLREKNLLKTIHLNLPHFEDIKRFSGKMELGRPVWEAMPISFEDTENVKNATETYLGRMLPITRLIHLHSSGQRMLLGDGLVYKGFADGFTPESTATVIVRQSGKKQEHALLPYRPTKGIWRELGAVVVKRKSEEVGGPLSLRSIQDGEDFDLVVSALARDQATIVDTVESVFHIPSTLCTSNGIEAYDYEVKYAERISSRLGWAIEEYRKELDGGWEGRLKGAGASKGELKTKLHSIATIHYWTSAEKNLSLLMNHIKAIGTEDSVPTREAWRKMLFSSACDSYRIACGQDTPRQIRAFAKGWDKLTRFKDEKGEMDSDNESKEENK